ncbi:MAG: tyrosine-type recombinase/integrase, partial [Nitrospirota bacterium]|nr:tyrosine-type recombinase/integrase [Nitrospirota bacterium]
PHALDRVWRRVRSLAGLSGLRLHDLRHNYASVAVTTGEELRTVAGLLGHTQVATTMGYAHLAEAPVIAAAGRVCGQLAEALTPSEPVTPIQPRPPRLRSRRSARSKPPKPTLDSLSDAERLWEPHIQAFRKGRLKLTEFCKERGLDPQQMRPFLAKHYQRAKGAAS